LFSRLNYSYQDKYLFTGIVRRDGSTRFGPNKKYGVFPSFSAGWNVSRENFWPSNNIVNSLKIRGGYGVVGNDNSGDFQYLARIVGGYNYSPGNSGAVTTGYAPETLDNPNLHWEQTASADVGFEATVLRDFTLTFDWYNRKTSGILRQVVIPSYVGVSANPWDNVADMKNSGVELELGYRKSFGKLRAGINANFSYIKNTVTYVSADTNFLGGGASFQSMGAVTRIQVGQPYNDFFGYQALGVFQNEQEIQNYKDKNGNVIQPNARPGDFKWADLNGDGTISSDNLDRTFLGSNIPKYTFGFTINLEYEGFDFMVFGQGVAGNKIFQGLRRLDILTSNYSTEALGRWHGEGTSADYPRLIDSDPNGNFSKMSNFYLENGDYLRLKVVQLGYTLPNRLFRKVGVSKFRVYVTGENLLTLTNYTGYDPEVGGGIFGIDRGQYPQARSILGGVQLSF
jgi:TonB-linked SusC/RagA family outer membrane protein